MASEVLKKPGAFYDKFERKVGNDKITTHYCPGCGHGRVHKLIAEALEDLGMADATTFISPVGCSVFAYYYFDTGNIQAAHGRAPAVGTGAARANPHGYVISYQGDGDLAGIGGNEIVQAANRGEKMSVFFVNNAIYGMTGGQMAPTTLEGQKTATSPYGRNAANEGYPIRMAEMIAGLEAPVFVERCAVTDYKSILKARKAIQKALKAQRDGLGFTFVEILAPCPTSNRMEPLECRKWVEEKMFPVFPRQTFKDLTESRQPRKDEVKTYSDAEVYQALDLKPGADDFSGKRDFVKNFTEQRIRIAGFGGQGVMVAGETLCILGMLEGLEVTWIPSYGPEMRGGTSNCHVTLSGRKIGSPLVVSPNGLIVMNGPSLDEFEPIVEKGGHILVNSSIIDRKVARTDVKVIYVPVTDIANSVGLRAAANMVALGAYLAFTNSIPAEKLFDVIRKYLKKKSMVDTNIQAIQKGIDYVKNQK